MKSGDSWKARQGAGIAIANVAFLWVGLFVALNIVRVYVVEN